MPASGGGFTQGFNAQACVDVATLLIIVAQTTQQVNDKQQIKPAIKELDKLRGQLGRVEELIADSGYFSQANVEACETAGMTPFIAVSREEHNQRLEDRLSKPEPVARDADSVTRMKHRLKTEAGKEVYGQRKCTVEPVFGIIKSVLGYNQFLRRGLENVKAEWKLVSLAWNLKRMHVLSKPSRKNLVMAGLDQSIGAF